jgi:hypothetical protein
MGTSDLFHLALLFGVWLAVIAIINYVSVLREAGGRRTPRVRPLARWTAGVGVGLVVANLTVALLAVQFVPPDTSYWIIVAAFAVAGTLQGAYLGLSLILARRLQVVKPA